MDFFDKNVFIIRPQANTEKANSILWEKFQLDLNLAHKTIFKNVYNVSYKLYKTKLLIFLSFFLICLKSLAKRAKYVIIYGSTFRTLILGLMIYTISFGTKKIIILEFAVKEFVGLKRLLLVPLIKRCYLIGVCSRHEIERYSKEFYLDKFQYIPAPIEYDYYLSKVNKCEFSYILSAGRGYRDYQTFIEAAFILEDLKFVLITDPENVSNINRIPKNIELLFNVERDLYFEYLKNAFAVVVPVKEHGCSAGHQVIYQAMAMGKVVIATGTNTIKEIITNKYNGLICHPGDSASIVSAIKLIINNKSIRNKISSNSKEKSNDFKIDNYIRLLRRAMVLSQADE